MVFVFNLLTLKMNYNLKQFKYVNTETIKNKNK